jgi:hypothetical protein
MITKYTSEIFDILRRGQFISSNSPSENIQTLYRILEDEHNFEQLYDYFIKINYVLEKADGYYYFSKEESKIELEKKLEKAYRWIDILDFFKCYDNSFTTGFRIRPSDIESQLGTNADLKSKLKHLKYMGSARKNNHEQIKTVIDNMVKEGFLELENEITSTYKVLDSFKYLEELIDTINIPEEIKNEIPE